MGFEVGLPKEMKVGRGKERRRRRMCTERRILRRSEDPSGRYGTRLTDELAYRNLLGERALRAGQVLPRGVGLADPEELADEHADLHAQTSVNEE